MTTVTFMACDISLHDFCTGLNGKVVNITIILLLKSKSILSIRILWVILIAVCFWLCGTMISNIWKQWQLNPMKLSLAEKEMSIMAIPFPTVTICPEIKTDKAKFDLSKTLHKVQYSEKEYE